jgi:hypothetical protein
MHQSGDRITLKPGTAADIQKVIQQRTSASSASQISKPLKPGKASTDWLAVQRSREQFVPWTEFPATLERDKLVQIVSDGGARPNPGSAGWGALIRQSGKCTWNWGHWDHTSNSAMELTAVVEAMKTGRRYPPPMHPGNSPRLLPMLRSPECAQ